MGIILWIIFGALAGWIASIIMRTNENQGWVGNILVGILGALLGGWIAENLGAAPVTGFNFYSLAVAVGGACLALFIFSLLRGNRGTRV